MAYFSLKKRSIPQLFLIGFGSILTLSLIFSLLSNGFKVLPETIGGLVVSLGCIWSGTSPSKKEASDKEDHFDDILDN